MTFFDFLAKLNWWQTMIFWAIAVVWFDLTLNMIFRPITKRLDTLNSILKNVNTIVQIEKQEERQNDTRS